MTVHSETVPGGRYWSMVIRRGYALRIVDPTGRANAATLLFNPHNLLERYNMADTLKAQHTSKLTKGHMLYSDMGRVLLSIVEDTLGWHDPDRRHQHAGRRAPPVRRIELPARPQRVLSQRPRAVPDRARQVGTRPAGSRGERELLQPRSRRRRWRARVRGRARQARCIRSSCARRWTRWSCSIPRLIR